MRLRIGPAANFDAAVKAALKRQIGAKVERIVFDLHDRLLAATPVNTGRTLASWKVTAGAPSNYDAVSDNVFITPAYPTNHLPIGSEPDRSRWEAVAREGRDALRIRDNPYQRFFISNAAKLDSMANNSLPQGPGSRATLLDLGAVPGYDLYSHPNGQMIFDPRGEGFYRIALVNFKRDNKLL